jgi:hypothetical protein
VPENSTLGGIVTEVIWIVGTVAVSYIAIDLGRKSWKLGKTLVSSKLSKS